MFSDLFDFSLERSGLQALGFYIAFLGIFMIMAVTITIGSFTFFHPANAQASAMTASNIGKAVAFVGTNMLCLAIGLRKGYKIHMYTVLMMFLAGILSFVIGAIGGLIPAAAFTTFKTVGTGSDS
jgi:hypothetical protein